MGAVAAIIQQIHHLVEVHLVVLVLIIMMSGIQEHSILLPIVGQEPSIRVEGVMLGPGVSQILVAVEVVALVVLMLLMQLTITVLLVLPAEQTLYELAHL